MRNRSTWGRLLTGFFALAIILAAFGAFTSVTLFDGATAVAQEDGAAPPKLGGDGDGDGDGGANAANPPPPGDGPAKKPDTQTRLAWMYEALGPFFSIVFLGLSFTLVALFVMNLLVARRDNVVPVQLVEAFEAHLNEKKYQEAYELAKTDESFLGQVLSAGLAKLSAGYEKAIEAMQEVGEEENMKLEHRLSYMALIGTISPMVGLFGTVYGMIEAFEELATAAGTAPNPASLAGAISTALFTTLLGLVIAIPAIAAYNILRNRVARLVLEVGIISEGLMSRFETVGKKATTT